VVRSRITQPEARSQPESRTADVVADASADQTALAVAETHGRPRWLVLAIAAAAALVVVGGVLAAFLVPAMTPPSSPTSQPGNQNDGTVAVTVVPPPVLVSATRSADGAVATIVWKTAKPQGGDQYQWVREGTTDAPTVTAKPRAVLAGLTAGAPACIDITTVRAGRTSEPLKACTP
jgi:hypothetical protein